MTIICENLGRSFNGVAAVSNVSFGLEAGQSMALIGPNGAGKSTTLGMLTTVLKPDHGSAQICGFDVATQARDVRRHIGVLFQDATLDDTMTPIETLEFHAALHGIARKGLKDRISAALHWAGLESVSRSVVRGFSGGMKRRLELARSMLHRPDLLILDEPTLGLDPQGRIDLWARVSDLRSQGMAILLTTHVLSEAESCGTIGILHQGKLIALDSKDNLTKSYGTSANATLEDAFLSLTGRQLQDRGGALRPALVRARA